ncbi:MAG: transglutaminase family protein [Chloroflexota bacterium]
MRTSEGEGVPRGQDVDWRSVDWSRARHAVYEVHQRYAYAYSGAVEHVRQRLVMIPRERHGDQRLLEDSLAVTGAESSSVSWEADPFGNHVARVWTPHVEHELAFEVRYRVARDTGAASRSTLTREWGDGRYLESTALTAPDDALRAVADDLLRDGDGKTAAGHLALAERVHAWAAAAIAYQIGVTGVQTPAAMALHLGKGVCQDYAHLMISVSRLVGIPARYVSGHLLGEGAPHAWVEALIADANDLGQPEVVAFDPTHHRRAGLNYITVAVGRDYADVAPTSGTFVGAASGQLTASKHAEIVEIVYEDGTVWGRTSAAAQDAESAA